MLRNFERYKNDLSKLIALGDLMSLDLHSCVFEDEGTLDKDTIKKIKGIFDKDYQNWYTEASSVIRQLLPSRFEEFESLYKADSKRKQIGAANYTIQDWLSGVRSHTNYLGNKVFDDHAAICNRFVIQLNIVKSLQTRFESSLFDIQQLVKADLFDSELEVAKELLKNGFLRASGVTAGVVLEKHLAQVCVSHGILVRKKQPSISDYNDDLKNNDAIDIPNWRFIQRLGDIRNLCGHNKDREPTKDEVQELIGGVDKVTKTLF